MEHMKGKIRISSNLPHHICGAGESNSGYFAMCDAGDYAYTKEEGEANAARFVKCWNNHDALTEERNALLLAMFDAREAFRKGKKIVELMIIIDKAIANCDVAK